MRLRKLPVLLVSLCLAAIGSVRAQEAPNPMVPLTRPAAAGAMSRDEVALSLAAAQRAQEMGMSTAAAALYRQLLDAPDADRPALTLALAGTLLDAGRPAEAEQALQADPGVHGAAWHLRAGLAAAQLKKFETARAEFAAIRQEELTKPDRGWYWFLQGVLLDLAPVQDHTTAVEFYRKAKEAAVTDLARTRFDLAERRAAMQGARPTKEAFDNVLRTFEKSQGTDVGYETARVYAVMLALDDRSTRAVEFLQEVLRTLPTAMRGQWDEFRFLIGLIGDRSRNDSVGRRYLFQLLESGSDANWQRMGLELLADASQTEATRNQFSLELDKLIALKPAHRILENLLLFRADVALAEKKYPQARDTAERLLKDFPGSPLRAYANAVQTRAAWEIGSYRIAAASAAKAHDELKANTETEFVTARAWLGLLKAEAYFRAGETGDGDAIDYRNAADAYEAALKERPAGVAAGDLMFQRVLAEIRAGALDRALPLLDALAGDPSSDFGVENRWKAEWLVTRALQVQGKSADAYARVNRLLAERRENLPGASAKSAFSAELRARMSWLQARLSFDAGQPDQTLTLVDKLAEATSALEASLKAEILSTGALLKVEAEFALGDAAKDQKAAADFENTALEILKKLRGDFPKSDAAASSYLVEAQYYATPGRDRIDEARKSLKKLADEFPSSPYAPHAQFQAALLAERLGQAAGYEEANNLLVDLVTKYPQSDLVFEAQLREGGLLMKLNQYPQAQRVFQELVNKFSQHRDVTRAQLELAICIDAQSANNPALLELARTKFADLRDRVDAPDEVRVEAGYHLGDVLVRRGNPDEAAIVWWRDVKEAFLPETRSADELGAKGCYWMARALFAYGDICRQQEKLEEARLAWQYVLQKHLPFEIVARAKLKDVGVLEAKP